MVFTKSDHKENIDSAVAVFKTNMGSFKVQLYLKECPETGWNFINLTEGVQKTSRDGNYYDGLTFHRVINGFMIQGGCPLGNGTGGPGYHFKDEFHPLLRHDSPGLLSMANAGPATNGSQFFITLAATPHLDGKHSVFGKVVEGLEIVIAIGSVSTDIMDRPNKTVRIDEITINR